MSNTSCAASPLPRVAFRPARTRMNALLRLIVGLQDWFERARSRRILLALDDRLLRDVGLSRADAEREGSRAFWER